jgi:L-asparagine oxygenase
MATLKSVTLLHDESHNQTWTIDAARAVELSRSTNEAPRYYSYAPMAELVQSRFGGAAVRVTQGPLGAELLASGNLLVLNHCCRRAHRHQGVGGEAIFAAAEIEAIRAAVEAGMGLLVLGEFEIDSWGSNVNDVLQPFGLRFNDDVATIPAQGVRGPLRLPVFETTAIARHVAAGGARKISYCAGCTITLLDAAAAAVVVVESGAGAVLMAAAEAGRGRVIAVGDSDLFAEPFLSYNDNRALLVGLIAWLSGVPAAASAEQRPAGSDLRGVPAMVNAPADLRGVPAMVNAPADLRGVPARVDAPADLRGVPAMIDPPAAHDLVAQGLTLSREPAPGTVVDLDDETRRRTRQLLAGKSLDPTAPIAPIDPYEDFEAFAFAAKLVFHELSLATRRVLVEFAHRGNVDGALLLRGFPQDPWIPPTPVRTGERAAKATHASELWLCAVAAALGEPVGYLQEKQGSIFQDVFPTPANAGKLSSESSSILLDFHTEIAFHPFMPDYLLLYGLRQDPDKEARTIFASVRRFLHLLAPADKDTLFANLFRTGIDYSFGNSGQQRGAGPLVSVLYGDRLDPFLRYDLDLMVGQTAPARRALELVRELVNDVQRDVVIEPGSLLVLDNRRCVHARSTFRAAYDGNDRWLQRVAVVRDLEASMQDRMRGTRVIATDFSRYLGPPAAAPTATTATDRGAS